MANVIDIIISAKDAASAPIRNVQASLGGLNSTLAVFGGPLGLVTTGLVTLAGGATAAVLSVKSLAKEAEHLSNVAQQTGTNVESIQTVSLLFQQAGLSAEDAGLALKFLSKNISEANPLLGQLGVTSKDSYTALLQLADAFSGAADGPNKIAIGLELLGRAGNIAIPVLNKGSAAFREIAAAGAQTGAIIGTDMIGKLTAADDAFDRLNLAIRGLRVELATTFLPTITKVIEKLPKMIEEIKGAIGLVFGSRTGASSSLNAFIGPPAPSPGETAKRQLPGIGVTLDDLREAVAWSSKLVAMKPVLGEQATKGFRASAVFKPDSMVDVPVAVLDAKTAALEGFKQAMDDITDAGTVMSDSLHLAFSALEEGFRGIFDSIVTGGRGFADALRGLFRGLVNAILAELARLAAASLFKVLLGFIAPGASALLIGPPAPAGTKRAGPAPELGSTGLGGNTYIAINAFDLRSGVMQLRSPGGTLRSAFDRLATQGSFS